MTRALLRQARSRPRPASRISPPATRTEPAPGAPPPAPSVSSPASYRRGEQGRREKRLRDTWDAWRPRRSRECRRRRRRRTRAAVRNWRSRAGSSSCSMKSRKRSPPSSRPLPLTERPGGVRSYARFLFDASQPAPPNILNADDHRFRNLSVATEFIAHGSHRRDEVFTINDNRDGIAPVRRALRIGSG